MRLSLRPRFRLAAAGCLAAGSAALVLSGPAHALTLAPGAGGDRVVLTASGGVPGKNPQPSADDAAKKAKEQADEAAKKKAEDDKKKADAGKTAQADPGASSKGAAAAGPDPGSAKGPDRAAADGPAGAATAAPAASRDGGTTESPTARPGTAVQADIPDPAPFSAASALAVDDTAARVLPVEQLGALTGLSFGPGLSAWPVLLSADLVAVALLVRMVLRRRARDEA